MEHEIIFLQTVAGDGFTTCLGCQWTSGTMDGDAAEELGEMHQRHALRRR